MRNYTKLFINKIFISIALVTIGLIPSYFANASIITADTIYVPLINANQMQPTSIPISTPKPTTIPVGGTYYVSPTGNDNRSGKTESEAWATFNRAWQSLYPGNTLVLLDGVYHQSLNPNVRNGEPGNPITIRAKNDGKAIIEGDSIRIPVKLGDTWPGPIGNYFVIEGIVARNSSDSVFWLVGASHNILRRVSGYNANTDTNVHVFTIWADDNLIEDCVAGGTGRKMIMVYQGANNIIRRCLSAFTQFDSREYCDPWPNGEGIQLYHGKNNIIENSISFGNIPDWGISMQANDPNAVLTGNKILGSMVIFTGMNRDGTLRNWASTRPGPTSCSLLTDFNWPHYRSGFEIHGSGEVTNNVFQDILSYGNAGLGLAADLSGIHSNNKVVRATILNNGIDNPDGSWGTYGGIGTDALQDELSAFSSVENSYIKNIFIDWPNYYNGGTKITATMNGEGARLTKRYYNGVITNDPLWPWPMEQRIRSELGLSVTNILAGIIPSQVSPIP